MPVISLKTHSRASKECAKEQWKLGDNRRLKKWPRKNKCRTLAKYSKKVAGQDPGRPKKVRNNPTDQLTSRKNETTETKNGPTWDEQIFENQLQLAGELQKTYPFYKMSAISLKTHSRASKECAKERWKLEDKRRLKKWPRKNKRRMLAK